MISYTNDGYELLSAAHIIRSSCMLCLNSIVLISGIVSIIQSRDVRYISIYQYIDMKLLSRYQYKNFLYW